MQTLETFRELYDYDDWANGEFLRFLREKPEARAAKAFAHLLLGEIIWLRRMRENLDTSGFDFWSGESVEDCEKLFAQAKEIYEEFFAELTEEKLDTVFSYKNSKGVAFDNTYREALQHVFLHSAYHRGQMAQAIRQAGNAPPYTDFIQFLRLK